MMVVSSRRKSEPLDQPDELYKDVRERTERRERALDETLAETFPASDPLSSDPAPEPPDDEIPERDRIAS
jgi:hypothetical protein